MPPKSLLVQSLFSDLEIKIFLKNINKPITVFSPSYSLLLSENLIEYVTVMACIAVKGVPVAGVIRKPFTDETYWAWVGSPSLNVQPKLVQVLFFDTSKPG